MQYNCGASSHTPHIALDGAPMHHMYIIYTIKLNGIKPVQSFISLMIRFCCSLSP